MKKSVRSPLIRALSLVFALVMLLSVLSACTSTGSDSTADNTNPGTSSGENSGTSGGEEKLAAEQVLNLKYLDLDSLDVNAAYAAEQFLVLTAVQEGLFRTFTDENGVDVIENAGCIGYDVSDDNLTYTFHLREDSVWSDGVPVTAQNYVDSWLRLISPDATFTYAELALGIAGAAAYYDGEGSADDVGLEVIDEHTFTATLDSPDSTFIKKVNMIPFYPIRLDLIEAAEASGADWDTDYTLHVFNGPFVISNRVLENSMTLTPNETYWDADSIILTQVNLQVVDETSTQAQLIESQQLDILSLSDLEYVQKWEPLVENGTLIHIATDTPTVNFLVLNQHEAANGGLSGLMGNEKVRLALSLALDREEFVALFQEDLATPAYGVVPFGMTAGSTEFRSYQEEPLLDDEYVALAADPAALAALFEEGAREAGYTGDISDVVLTTMVYNPTTAKSNQLEWFKQQFESKLGIKVDIVICPDLSAEQTARAEYQYDFYTLGWGADYNDPIAFLELFTTGGSYSKLMGGFSDEEYDSLVSQIKASQDETERLDLIVKAENILITKGGIIPYYYPQSQVYYQSYIKNLSLPAFGADFEFSRAYIAEH